MAGRIAVHVGIGEHSIVAYIHFPGTVWIEAAQRNVDLIAGAVHIIHHGARHFGKHLLGVFLGIVERHVGHLQNGVAASGGNARAVKRGQAFY